MNGPSTIANVGFPSLQLRVYCAGAVVLTSLLWGAGALTAEAVPRQGQRSEAAAPAPGAALPAVPPRPPALPAPVAPDPAGILSLPAYPLGEASVGHLRPRDITPLRGADWATSPLLNAGWLQGIALPIYPSPDSPPWGWLINGWLIPNNAAPLAIGRDAAFAMMPTDRRIFTFPVLEVRSDGWFRFQYTAAGYAWAHTSHLSLGAVDLTVQPWAAYTRNAQRVTFRRPGLSQPVRLAPRSTAPLQALAGTDSLIQPLDMEGDWLRVRVTQPVQGCRPLPGATVSEGWVRWQDEDKTPLVAVPVGGC